MVHQLNYEDALRVIEPDQVPYHPRHYDATLPSWIEDKKEDVHRKIIDMQQQLYYYREFDPVTDLYNKNHFYHKTAILLQQHPEQKFVLVRLDIERFKMVNELFGREEGDRLLQFVGQALKYVFAVYPVGVYARLQADVFAMCIPYQRDLLEEILHRMERMIIHYRLNFEIIPYFGFYVIEDHQMAVDVMCDRAHMAIKTVKGNVLKRFAFYDAEMHQRLLREQDIIRQMNTALQEEQFVVYLQPKYDLRYNRVVGAEALVRWQHPEDGLIPPVEFVPLFERNGFIMKLDEYVWEKTCQIIRRWIDEGRDVQPISVNVSKVNLYNPNLCDTIINLTKKYQISPALLALEITESAYTDNANFLNDAMIRLQGYGFSVMMDDFGSGYSSLNMLKELLVDVLKIDLRFLAGDGMNSRSGSILSSVVDMAQKLSLDIVAEGIETKEQAEFLQKIGCNKGQGFYFAKPIPVNEYERLFKVV